MHEFVSSAGTSLIGHSYDATIRSPLVHGTPRLFTRYGPGVYANGLLYMPKKLRERPAPAMLCPHGHWPEGSANVDNEQKRCLTFAKMGYITFAPTQNHYEDLAIGVSNQTLGVWSNMRAIDYLESLPDVDRNRIGSCGISGGGLQTQYLAALDHRVKAGTIAGYTCDCREFVLPWAPHCSCNHFPGIMQYADLPEISASLAFPTPIQYLTMNDWTMYFRHLNYPTIENFLRR